MQPINGSIVNQLDSIVPNKRMSFSARNIGTFRYQYMLSCPNEKVEISQDVISLYDEIEKQYRYSVSFYDDETNYAYIRDLALGRFHELGYEREDICDILTEYLFHAKKSKRKNIFWMCFGDVVLRNLKQNIPSGSIQCKKCGERFIPKSPQQQVCARCAVYHPVGKKQVKCADCGITFEVDSRNMKKIRCDNCQKEYRKLWDRERKRANIT